MTSLESHTFAQVIFLPYLVWWTCVVVSALALINEVDLRRARLVWDRRRCPGSIPGAGHLFRYVTNQPPKANSTFHPSGVGKWGPASAGKAKTGMLHSVSGCAWGVQVKLWDPLRTCAIPERFRSVFTTRHYTNPHLPFIWSSHNTDLLISKYVHFISARKCIGCIAQLVKCPSLAGELTLSCARPSANGWPLCG